MGLELMATAAGRYDAIRRLLFRLDRTTRATLLASPSSRPTAGNGAGSPIRAMLLQLLSTRRRAHSRRLWARWLEPVMIRQPDRVLAAASPPGCIHAADLAGWWLALSRRMGDLPARAQADVERRLVGQATDRVMASEEAGRWADALRLQSIASLLRVRADALSLTVFLDEVNEERTRALGLGATPAPAASRRLDGDDLDTLLLALRVAPTWTQLDGRAADMEVDELLSDVRKALTGGGVPPNAMALYAVAGLYNRRDPLLGAALRALLPLPLVEAAVAWINAESEHRDGAPAQEVQPLPSTQAYGLDSGLRALFEAAVASGQPLSPTDAKRLGRALAGVVEAPSLEPPMGPISAPSATAR